MATLLPLPGISVLAPHLMGVPSINAGLPPLSSPLSPNPFARLLDAREQTQQQSLASVVAAAMASSPALKPVGGTGDKQLPTLPSLGFPALHIDTGKNAQLPTGPLGVSSPTLESQLATGNLNDEMDVAANAVLSTNPVTPPPQEPATACRLASIDAILSPKEEQSSPTLSFQPAGNLGSPSRGPSMSDSFRLPSMHSSAALHAPATSASALCGGAHQKPADASAVKAMSEQPQPARSRGRAGGARGDFGPQMNQSRYWTEAEHQRFLQAVRTFGAHNHKAIASFVATRSSAQVRSHSQKFFKKLETFRGQGLPSMTRKRKTLKDISMHQ